MQGGKHAGLVVACATHDRGKEISAVVLWQVCNAGAYGGGGRKYRAVQFKG